MGLGETQLTGSSPASPRMPSSFVEQSYGPSESLMYNKVTKTKHVAASPMERYWVEPQRHEQIAIMMTKGGGLDPARSTRSHKSPQMHPQHAKRKPSSSNDRVLNEKSPSTSPRFCPGLVIDQDADGIEDEHDLEAIKIAARIKSVFCLLTPYKTTD